jgi:hypothetical protein
MLPEDDEGVVEFCVADEFVEFREEDGVVER